jgi:hypothetical protein
MGREERLSEIERPQERLEDLLLGDRFGRRCSSPQHQVVAA